MACTAFPWPETRESVGTVGTKRENLASMRVCGPLVNGYNCGYRVDTEWVQSGYKDRLMKIFTLLSMTCSPWPAPAPPRPCCLACIVVASGYRRLHTRATPWPAATRPRWRCDRDPWRTRPRSGALSRPADVCPHRCFPCWMLSHVAGIERGRSLLGTVHRHICLWITFLL